MTRTLSLLCLATILCTLDAIAASQRDEKSELKYIGNARFDELTGQIRSMVGLHWKSTADSPKDAARAFLSFHQEALGLQGGLVDLRVEVETQTRVGAHVLFRQYYRVFQSLKV